MNKQFQETEGQILENQIGYLPTAEKRPFCNAFTGCGKKRSTNFENLENRELTDPLMRLSRKIIQEAKQWEILQHRIANNEVVMVVILYLFLYQIYEIRNSTKIFR